MVHIALDSLHGHDTYLVDVDRVGSPIKVCVYYEVFPQYLILHYDFKTPTETRCLELLAACSISRCSHVQKSLKNIQL